MTAQPALLLAALGGYVAAGAASVVSRARREERRNPTVVGLSVAGIAAQVAFVAVRAAAVGFLPFASRFEAMLLYALAIQAAGLGLYLVVPKPGVKAAGDLAGAALVVVVLAKFGFEPGGALNPILSSPWFAVHILLAFAGYGLLTVGLVWTIVSMFDPGVRQPAGVPFRLASAVVVTLGAGILTGAMWADESWGTFWNWDPKESWALLAWTVMVTYVHVAGREPRRWLSALFYVGAFAVMAFTFVGINLLKWGAHRY